VRRLDGINIKDLARELSVTSRQLIDRCRAEGIPVQNSITKLSPEVADRVRNWFREQPPLPDAGKARDATQK